MHKFWYHSPLRFYKTKEELSDMTNPQNCQFFGAKNPYPLEKGELHRFIIPNVDNEVITTNLKLFLVGDTEQEIQSLMTVIDDKLCAVTFKCDDFIQGHFEIRNYSEPIFYSNCVKFIDSTDSDGRKYIRIATKHNYDKNLFPYSKSHNLYCVTNLPAYDLGRFTAEVDAKNNRVGNSASLISSESYIDETIQYEFKAYGDANILSFIQVHAINNEFYINGTQRTAIDKMEADEFAILGKLKFTNVKNNLGLNKTINESDIFSDLQLEIIEKFPNDGFIEQASLFDGDIACKFNSDVYGTGDLTKKMCLFKNGIEILSKTFNQLNISGNIVSFREAIGDLEPADYVVKIDNGMFKNSYGNIFEGITNNTDWNFTLIEEITPTISISWEDGTNTDLRGTSNDITLKIKDVIYSPTNPIIAYSWESSIDGISYTQFGIGNSDKTVYLVPNNNFYRVKATLQDNSVIYSNVLKYTKEAITTTNYYFKAIHPYDYPGYDYVRYIDQYGNEQIVFLFRSYWADLNDDGMQQIDEWFEAPCTLIVANQILEVVGAATCTP